jgi:hypothetical protein
MEWKGVRDILLGSMNRWFLLLVLAGLPCMMAVATAEPAEDVLHCMQCRCNPCVLFRVRALQGRIIGLLAVGFTAAACMAARHKHSSLSLSQMGLQISTTAPTSAA